MNEKRWVRSLQKRGEKIVDATIDVSEVKTENRY